MPVCQRIRLAFGLSLAVAGVCLAAASSARAGESRDIAWDIGVSRVHLPVDGPRRIEVFGMAYWVLPYTFEPVVTQDLLQPVFDKLAKSGDDAGKKAFYAQQAKALADNAKQPRRLSPRMFLDIPGQPPRVDLADDGVRNWFERREKRRFLTANEIAALPLDKLQTRDDDSGRVRRKVVDALAIFAAPETWPSGFSIRLQGMGRHVNPGFEPEQLMFWDLARVEDPVRPGVPASYAPSLRKTLRFDYAPHSDAWRVGEYVLRDKAETWSWMWTQNIYAGSARMIEVKQPAGAKRTMLYVPYRIWNNTGQPQQVRVEEAGLIVPVSWQGAKFLADFSDRPERRDYWLTLAYREIERRQGGDESKYVAANDVEPAEGVDLEADAAAKADLLPAAGGQRHPDQNLAPQARAKGVMVLTAELSNLMDIVEELRSELAAWTLMDRKVDDPKASALYKAYRELVVELPKDAPEMARLGAATRLPDRELVWRRIMRVAAAEMAGLKKEPSVAEARVYNTHDFAPVVEEDVLDWAAFGKAVSGAQGPAGRVSASLSDTAKGLLAGGAWKEWQVVLDAFARVQAVSGKGADAKPADWSGAADQLNKAKAFLDTMKSGEREQPRRIAQEAIGRLLVVIPAQTVKPAASATLEERQALRREQLEAGAVADLARSKVLNERLVERLAGLDAVNRMLARPDLFDAEVLKGLKLDAEGADMLDRGLDFERKKLTNLQPKEWFKLNRLVLDRIVGDKALRPCLDWAWVGGRLNLLALDVVKARAKQGLVDVYFEADVNGRRENTELAMMFRKALPPEFPPYVEPEPPAPGSVAATPTPAAAAAAPTTGRPAAEPQW